MAQPRVQRVDAAAEPMVSFFHEGAARMRVWTTSCQPPMTWPEPMSAAIMPLPSSMCRTLAWFCNLFKGGPGLEVLGEHAVRLKPRKLLVDEVVNAWFYLLGVKFDDCCFFSTFFIPHGHGRAVVRVSSWDVPRQRPGRRGGWAARESMDRTCEKRLEERVRARARLAFLEPSWIVSRHRGLHRLARRGFLRAGAELRRA